MGESEGCSAAVGTSTRRNHYPATRESWLFDPDYAFDNVGPEPVYDQAILDAAELRCKGETTWRVLPIHLRLTRPSPHTPGRSRGSARARATRTYARSRSTWAVPSTRTCCGHAGMPANGGTLLVHVVAIQLDTNRGGRCTRGSWFQLSAIVSNCYEAINGACSNRNGTIAHSQGNGREKAHG